MFRATMCPSSGKKTMFLQHLVLVVLCGWLSDTLGAPSIPDSHPHRITSTKRCKNTVVSPDDGDVVTRNVQRLINILRINCAPSWVYLQDCTGMHGEQNVRFIHSFIHSFTHSLCFIPRLYTYRFLIRNSSRSSLTMLNDKKNCVESLTNVFKKISDY